MSFSGNTTYINITCPNFVDLDLSNFLKPKGLTRNSGLQMKIEKMRSRALEKMTNRIALAKKKAKEMRASTHTARSDQAAKTVQQVKQVDVSPVPKSAFICCFKA